MSGPPEAPSEETGAENARLIAAQAKSLRATLLRDRPPNLPVSAGELADAIELLADEVADLVERIAK